MKRLNSKIIIAVCLVILFIGLIFVEGSHKVIYIGSDEAKFNETFIGALLTPKGE